MLQGKLQKNANGEVVVLNGGVDKISLAISQVSKILVVVGNIILNQVLLLEWEQNQVQLQNAGGGQPNPWKTGNITQQMLLSEQDPQMAAVLKQEAQTK